MTEDRGFQHHWLEIGPERMDRYEAMFEWNTATEHFYAAAEVGEGQTVCDFGCGPGHAAIAFARWVGPAGHVHAMDINAEFVRRARRRAAENGLEGRISVHLLTEAGLPLPDASLDRVIARNTIVYVPDPLATFGAFRRVLRPGGIAHAIESDWRLTAVEPVPTDEWRAIIEAARWAWPHPEIGRRLYGIARRAGFDDVSLQVLTSPDTEGRLLGMIRTVAGYAEESGTLEPERIVSMLQTVEAAIADGRYLAVAPQFIATAKA